ncbi:MAG TPA: type II toxin-antitoxin system Phd/YefM family antitoxin [Bryobacteraceae bacterium]|jgi:PHD/YefM family antitoxin component YafN of YafNO toxin-antitoxin module
MINVAEDIQSLTAFKRNTNGMMKKLRKTRRPLVLTVKGKAEMVLLDPKSYQYVAEQLDTIAAIQRGLDQVDKGQFRPIEEVFDEIEKELDIEESKRVPRRQHH